MFDPATYLYKVLLSKHNVWLTVYTYLYTRSLVVVQCRVKGEPKFQPTTPQISQI